MSEERPNVPLFLSDAEMENQARVLTWRGGVTDVSGSIFQTPRSTVDFPRIFNIIAKREAPKTLPFSYKTVLKSRKSPFLKRTMRRMTRLTLLGLLEGPYAPQIHPKNVGRDEKCPRYVL